MGDNTKVIVCKTPKEKQDFLDLPKRIYEDTFSPQDRKLEEKLLKGKHVLSHRFTVIPVLMYQTAYSNYIPLSRCIITLYENDDNAYIGLFDSVDNYYIYKKFLSEVEKKCKKLGKKKIIGPVDASFWINYRFKYRSDNKFTDSYSGEPYNKIRYTQMWLDAGFDISETYISNMYRQIQEGDKSAKCELRIRQMKDRGYKFRNCSYKTFDKDLKIVYKLMINLYSTFPTFKHIEWIEFKQLFSYLKYILNYSMTWIVEKDSEAVAFFICVPNYHKMNLETTLISKLITFLKLRKKPEEYVMLYMGVDKKALGLGSALAGLTKEELYKNGCTSIGALVHGSKPTGNYYKDLIVGKTEYVLLEKILET